jgi:UDPglucose--hexose-1-phosphate uridylyltransferase
MVSLKFAHKSIVYNKKGVSELRQDLVSGDWVVIATGRAKRPHEFLKRRHKSFVQPKLRCPFEHILKDALLIFSKDKNHSVDDWFLQVVPNKYPAFGKGICAIFYKNGPYQWTEGVGFHEVVITRDHERSLALMSDKEAELVLRAYQDRYMVMKDDDCVKYISIFHNHGQGAGATISHPHSQIIAIPVIPPDVDRSLKGSAKYFHNHKACVHCVMLKYEQRDKRRIIYENEGFIVLAPFASKTAFEMRIFPRRHFSHFESTPPKSILLLSNALRVTLAKLYNGLRNPDYNFFIHTAPASAGKEYDHYHWHLEILPKTSIWAGFEIGTGIEISSIAPESAAEFLRKIKV